MTDAEKLEEIRTIANDAMSGDVAGWQVAFDILRVLNAGLERGGSPIRRLTPTADGGMVLS